jgi:hypothetical protein
MYQNHYIVGYQLAKQFILLSREILGFQLVAELRLYHVKGGFYITSLVVMPHELVPAEHEVMVLLRPSVRAF